MVMLFAKIVSLIAGFILVLTAVSAGYAVTYATNAFGYSDGYNNVTINTSTNYDGYSDYPEYYNTSSYYYNGSNYYYPSTSYNYYVTPVNYVTQVRPVYYYVPTYTTYTVVQPVYYTNTYYTGAYYYPNGWY